MVTASRLLAVLVSLTSTFYVSGQVKDTLIDVGTVKLHFNIHKGHGMPILFESGNGDDASVWKDILKNISDATGATLITYDRAGLGSSTIDTTKIGLLNEVKSLEKALRKLGYDKKIMVVCHSFGSYYSTLFAKRNCRKVKSMVFIDVLTPCFFTQQRARDTKNSVSADDWKMLKKEAPGLYYVLQNLESIQKSASRYELPAKIPATVIGAGIPPPIVKDNEKSEWIRCLQAFGEAANHRYIFAKDCHHKVWKDNPILVVDAIVASYNNYIE